MNPYQQIGKPIPGGMGQVFHLYHKIWRIEVAMKQPKFTGAQAGRQQEKFRAECLRWIELGMHPNIVQCYSVQTVDGVLSAVSEWMNGGDLDGWIKAQPLKKSAAAQENLTPGSETGFWQAAAADGYGTPWLRTRLDMAMQSAAGLQYAHARGMLHLDVKPGNMMRSDSGALKINDFGISALLNEQQKERAFTPRYCAPEQKNGSKLGKYTDIYGWAVSMLHLFTGVCGWMDGTVAGMACGDYLAQAPMALPSGLTTLLQDCLQQNPASRPQSFEEVIARLKAIWRDAFNAPYRAAVDASEAQLPDALNNQALNYLEMGFPDKAETLWQQILARHPNHPEAFYNYHLYRNRVKGEKRVLFDELDHLGGMQQERLRRQLEWHYSIGAFSDASYYHGELKPFTQYSKTPDEEWAQIDRKFDALIPNVSGTKLTDPFFDAFNICKEKHHRFLSFGPVFRALPGGNFVLGSEAGACILAQNGEVKWTTGGTVHAVDPNDEYLAVGCRANARINHPWQVDIYSLQTWRKQAQIDGTMDDLKELRMTSVGGLTRLTVITGHKDRTKEQYYSITGRKLSAPSAYEEAARFPAEPGYSLSYNGVMLKCWDNGSKKLVWESTSRGMGAHIGWLNINGCPHLLYESGQDGFGLCRVSAHCNGNTSGVGRWNLPEPICGAMTRVCTALPDNTGFAILSSDGQTCRLITVTLPDLSLPDPLYQYCRFRKTEQLPQDRAAFEAIVHTLDDCLSRAVPTKADTEAIRTALADLRETRWDHETYLRYTARAAQRMTAEKVFIGNEIITADPPAQLRTLRKPGLMSDAAYGETTDKRYGYALEAEAHYYLWKHTPHWKLSVAPAEKADIGEKWVTLPKPQAIGITEDLRYLVLKTRGTNGGTEYRRYPLEWIFHLVY